MILWIPCRQRPSRTIVLFLRECPSLQLSLQTSGKDPQHPRNRSTSCFTPKKRRNGTLCLHYPFKNLAIRNVEVSELTHFLFLHRFRQEYRMERKLLNDDLSILEQPRVSYSVSRVVVLTNNQLETYNVSDSFDTNEFWSGSITWW